MEVKAERKTEVKTGLDVIKFDNKKRVKNLVKMITRIGLKMLSNHVITGR